MKEHIRLRALKRLCELLERETRLKVYRGRQVVGRDIPMPFLVINETIRSGDTRQVADEGRTTRNDRIDFLLSGYTDSESVGNPIDVSYEWIAKIEMAFNKIHSIKRKNGNPEYHEWYNLGGLVTDFNYEAPVAHNPPDEVQSKSYFYFYFSFKVAYDNADPYREDLVI